ncbi:hypothetical protein [Halanaerobium hydrogeniformans]|uniref:Porin domain-containing protein n=1 Tax=Halanaerobium hydrogeniformans TaxID=656519 RepID=E4RNU3_HALHG|nr:hypothetical protein [Halanaerobium hydrogeniformans]ADQ13771.1 hypothetical protein Halsa_0294 [Halanaerobium hydrogeniformans]
MFFKLKNNYKLLLTLFLIITFLFFADKTAAVELGGKLELESSLFYDDSVELSLSGRSEVEFFFADYSNFEPRFVLQSSLDDDGQAELEIKYLYLRHRKDNKNLTIGRQPVSWSYGAIINLLDYGLGIDDLASDTIEPGIDGFRYHHSLGQGRSLQLVTSFSELNVDDWEELGYGARLRLPGSGYDLSFQASYQPISDIENENDENNDNLLRAGMSYNRDIRDLGTYGSLGYFSSSDTDDIMLQFGIDYSWMIGDLRRRQVFLQAEYYRFLRDNLSAAYLAGLDIGGAEELGGDSSTAEGLAAALFDNRDFLLIDLSVQLDHFSKLGVIFMGESQDNRKLLGSYYTSELGGGFEIRFDGNLAKNEEDDYLYGISSTLSYYF